MNEYEPPAYLDKVGRLYFRAQVARVKKMRPEYVYGLGLLAYCCQRIVRSGGAQSPDDAEFRNLVDEYWPLPQKRKRGSDV